jgi:hypothetical protein
MWWQHEGKLWNPQAGRMELIIKEPIRLFFVCRRAMVRLAPNFNYNIPHPFLSIGNLHKFLMFLIPKFILDKQIFICYTIIVQRKDVLR